MKLGCAFNCFSDSIELLKASIEQIRPLADKIVVVYQNVSNYGVKAKETMLPYLNHLVRLGLIDQLVEYTPQGYGHQITHYNENSKRKLGQHVLYNLGCTHFITADCDEIYDTSELRNLMEIVETNNYDTSALFIQDFYKKPEYQIDGLASYFVPAIHNIFIDLKLGCPYFVYADPTRTGTGYTRPFQVPSEIMVMRHFTTIRIDLREKYNSSSANINFTDIEGMVKAIEEFEPGLRDDPKIIKVDDKYKINDSIGYYIQFCNDFETGLKINGMVG
jgi:hypothetical protein